MEYCIMVKIFFDPNGRTMGQFLNILRSVRGNVYIMKENGLRRVKNTLLGVYSLNIQKFDVLCVSTDSNETDLQNIKRQIQMIS